MTSILYKKRDYKYIGEQYAVVNDNYQAKHGLDLVVCLGINVGEKVLDMGCGTGEITAFIADQVGDEGHVVGVDPDKERIAIAVQKYSSAKSNITFVVGDSSSHFPHFNEEYYDIIFSNFVFHWLSFEERAAFVAIAAKCLKPGGRIAMHVDGKLPEIIYEFRTLFSENDSQDSESHIKLVPKSVTELMLSEACFEISFSQYIKNDLVFSTVDAFLMWICASFSMDYREILSGKKNAFEKNFAREDGTVCSKMIFHRIVAKKPELS